jgi:hypothetical protein
MIKVEYPEQIKITVDPRTLAHCKVCAEPLYCIYDQNLRSDCWECEQEMKELERILTKGG